MSDGDSYRVVRNAQGRVPWTGDGGGPAFIFNNNTRYLVGIQSGFGGACGTDAYQTNLPPLRDWIAAVFMSQWAPGAQSSPVKVYPAEVTGSKWGLQDVNTINWAQAARAAAAMCYNRGFAGGHFDGRRQRYLRRRREKEIGALRRRRARRVGRRGELGRALARHLVAGFLAIPGRRRHAAFAQLVFGHLAVLRHRQGVDEFQITRHGEIRHARLAVVE
jgi:hypothetical protein